MKPPLLRGGPHNCGAMRRRIVLDARTLNATVAGVEDDFHHFEVSVTHARGAVVGVVGRAIRFPWSTCPGAAAMLEAFAGVAIGPSILRRRDLPDPLTQCTHLYELAVLAIAQSGRGDRRVYDVEVLDRNGRTRFPTVQPGGQVVRPAEGADGRATARLWRDGALALAWDIDGDRIIAPEGFAGHTIWTVMRYAVPHCDDNGLEAARVLRRGVHVAGGRIFAFQDSPLASMNSSATGACHTFQPVRAGQAQRMVGAAFDFSADASPLLANFPESVDGR